MLKYPTLIRRLTVICFLYATLSLTSIEANADTGARCAADRLSVMDDIVLANNQRLEVYLGPGREYGRAANGKAIVSTNGWLQTLGVEDDWIMIQYEINEDRNRIGWIDAKVLPVDAETVKFSWEWIPDSLCMDTEITDDPFSSGASVKELNKGTKLYILKRVGNWVYIEIEDREQNMRGFVPAYTLASYRDIEGEIIGYCRNDKVSDDPWSTPTHIYQEPNEDSKIVCEMWGGNGEYYTLLEDRGGWLKVRKHGYEGYIQAQDISTYLVEKAPVSAVTMGTYVVGRDIPVGFYTYWGDDNTLSVESDAYEEGKIEYIDLKDGSELYLQDGSRVSLSVDERLEALDAELFSDNVKAFNMLLGDGRIFVPRYMDMDNGSYTFMLIDESSYIFEYDLLGNKLGTPTIKEATCGETYQLKLDEGRFLEYYNCLIEIVPSNG